MLVLLLAQVNYFAQYALCGLNWGYIRSDRLAVGVGLCLVAKGDPVADGLYVFLVLLERGLQNWRPFGG